MKGSIDGNEYFTVEDKRKAQTDYAHDFIARGEGIRVRFLKLTIEELPYNAVPCVSGIRVFGLGEGKPPKKVEEVTVRLDGDLDMEVLGRIRRKDRMLITLLLGTTFFGDMLQISSITAIWYLALRVNELVPLLNEGQSVYVRVDAFNAVGITEGQVLEIRK